jgi:hypothetical protein
VNPHVDDVAAVFRSLPAVIRTCARTDRGSRLGTATSTMRAFDTRELGWRGAVGYVEQVQQSGRTSTMLTVLLPAATSAAAIQVSEPGVASASELEPRVESVVAAARDDAVASPTAPPGLMPTDDAVFSPPPAGFVSLDAAEFTTTGQPSRGDHRRTWVRGNDVVELAVTRYASAGVAHREFMQSVPIGTPGDAFRVRFGVPGVPGARGVELADAGEYDEVDFVTGNYACQLVVTNSHGGNQPLAIGIARSEHEALARVTSS